MLDDLLETLDDIDSADGHDVDEFIPSYERENPMNNRFVEDGDVQPLDFT